VTAPAQSIVILLGVFCPGLVAISLTALRDGSNGVAALLRPLFQWNVGARWYLFAAAYMAAIKLSAAAIHRLLLGAWPRFGSEPLLLMIGATILSLVVGGQTGEEIGWRGYALPRLASRLGFGSAALLLGVIWAAWHLPLFFFLQGDVRGQSFVVYLLQVTALSVAFAWLYLKTGGSLLLTMLMHAAVNNTKDIVPSAVPGATNPLTMSGSVIAWLTVALLWICAAWFLTRMRGAMRA
jgi:membrane protease YdiL (CAAX protease family)